MPIYRTAFYTHPTFLKHEMGDDNPECPMRLEKIDELMMTTGTSRFVEVIEAPSAEYADLLAAHDPDYLYFLANSTPKDGITRLNVDTSMNPFTWEAARHAAGAGCDAVQRVCNGEFQRAFCAVRPPGHHAHRDHSGGFCFLNNVAIAALYAINKCYLNRVAIVDFDVHHGDGTSDILGGRDDVLIIDGFQKELFPYAHLHHAPVNALYSPFDEGLEGQEFMRLIDSVWMPKLISYKPDLILVSAGFDAHREEDQAQLLMVESNYAFIARRLVAAAASVKNCRGVVCMLEGGYSTSSLARSCTAFVRQLAGSCG